MLTEDQTVSSDVENRQILVVPVAVVGPVLQRYPHRTSGGRCRGEAEFSLFLSQRRDQEP